MNEKDDWVYKQVILQFELDTKPVPKLGIPRPQRIAIAKEWFDNLTAPAEEKIRKVGAHILERAWLTGEMLIAVAEPTLEQDMAEIVEAPDVEDWYLRDDLGPLEPRVD